MGNTAYIEKLEMSATKTLYLTVHLPEDRITAVSLKLTATAGKISAENGTEETEEIVKNAELVTQIQALQAAFEVTKTADRSMAVPGDEIRFLICIRNTGERTLHSIVTTERFQLGNVPVKFLEKDGVRLNKSKTKAKIEQIAPGEAFGLEAVVTLPEGLEDQNLVNEVWVTTLETGEQTKIAQSEIQVKVAEEEKQEVSRRKACRHPHIQKPEIHISLFCGFLCSPVLCWLSDGSAAGCEIIRLIWFIGRN